MTANLRSIWTLTLAATLLGGGGFVWAQPADDDAPPPPRREHEEEGRRWERDGRFEGGRMPGGRPPLELTAEQIDEGIAVLNLIHPAIGQRLAEARAKEPQRIQALMAQQWPRIERLVRFKASDPETFALYADDARLTRETFELAEQLLAAQARGESQRVAELQDQLRQRLNEQFDVRQKMQENEVRKLEERLEKLRARLKDRAERRQELILQRLRELAAGEERARW